MFAGGSFTDGKPTGAPAPDGSREIFGSVGFDAGGAAGRGGGNGAGVVEPAICAPRENG